MKIVWKPIVKELFRVTKDGGVVVWVVGDATVKSVVVYGVWI